MQYELYMDSISKIQVTMCDWAACFGVCHLTDQNRHYSITIAHLFYLHGRAANQRQHWSILPRCRLVNTSNQSCIWSFQQFDAVSLEASADLRFLDIIVLANVTSVLSARLRNLPAGISHDSHSKPVIMCVAFL